MEPGETAEFAFAYTLRGEDVPYEVPGLLLDADLLDDGARVTLPTRSVPLDLTLGELPDSFFVNAERRRRAAGRRRVPCGCGAGRSSCRRTPR